MSRRSIIPNVKISDILNNSRLKVNSINGIIIVDDVNCNDIETISKVVKFVRENNAERITLINCKKELYSYFVNYVKNNNLIVNVSFDKEKYSVKEIYNMYDESTYLDIENEEIYDNLFEINKEDLNKIRPDDGRILKGKKLTIKEITMALDYIARQVASYAENDIQKVLLVDKMLRENTSYDITYYENKEYFDNIMTDEGLFLHKAHILETIFVDRTVVCNVYSLFTKLLFKHPLLNSVKVNEAYGLCHGEGHAWNEIKIHNRWYTQDFTHNVWFDKRRGINYTLKHKTNSTLQKEDGSGFEYLRTMPEEVIRREYEKINNIHIKFPTMEQIKSGDFELSETVDNIISTRRPIKLSNSNETVTRRKIDFTDSNDNSTRRNIKIITRRRNVFKNN